MTSSVYILPHYYDGSAADMLNKLAGRGDKANPEDIIALIRQLLIEKDAELIQLSGMIEALIPRKKKGNWEKLCEKVTWMRLTLISKKVWIKNLKTTY